MFKKKIYRNIESVLKKFHNIEKRNKDNILLQKSIQSAIYNTSEKDDVLFLNKNKEKFLVHTHDTISKKLFIDFSFDFKIMKKALKLLSKNHKKIFLVNVGANIGSICVKAVKDNYFKTAIAFEPAKKHFRLLMANIYLNKLENRIKAYNIALSDKKTTLNLSLNTKGNLGDNRIIRNKNLRKKLMLEKVFCDKLDKFTSNLNKKNTLIFMDTQGYEPYIIKGGKKTIRKKIPIVMEFSPLLLDSKWLKNFEILFKNYKYFYNLDRNNKKNLFNRINLIKLFDELKTKEKNYTDLMII